MNLSAGRERDGVVFRVADTGVGISAEDLPRIGRRFEQVDNALTRKGEGTGLGLALSRALVELHGGTLEIESAIGEGTTVSVWLPATVSGSASGAPRDQPSVVSRFSTLRVSGMPSGLSLPVR